MPSCGHPCPNLKPVIKSSLSFSTPLSLPSLSQHHLTLRHGNSEVSVSGESQESRTVAGRFGGQTGSAGPRGAAHERRGGPPRPAPASPRLPPTAFGPGDPGLTLKRTGMSPGAGAPRAPTVNGTKSPEGAGQTTVGSLAKPSAWRPRLRAGAFLSSLLESRRSTFPRPF